MGKSLLLNEIERFMNRAAMPPTTFGRLALGDTSFVFELRKGRRTWPETAVKVRDFMHDYRKRQLEVWSEA